MKEVLSSPETSVLKELHGVTSQKKPFFIVTAVKTSNLTRETLPCIHFNVAHCKLAVYRIYFLIRRVLYIVPFMLICGMRVWKDILEMASHHWTCDIILTEVYFLYVTTDVLISVENA
jgi:hypothetical protein